MFGRRNGKDWPVTTYMEWFCLHVEHFELYNMAANPPVLKFYQHTDHFELYNIASKIQF
jgi:hypothetical protein